ncbi:DNA-binding protein [Clavibacter michiganensis subsp. michiganensis]|uniref:helix-turn-helix domain-containing protein n=1 Tax=Clavibacter michiganensis TaxID=28447 RepID=UPI000B70BC32|nr:helix-turn-helix domain-containing protein [Clavibacter michiganensis]MWJ18487.1 DNA-binding protein [Clavibacter michiganensis subsp. michiganensis]OUD96689.1 Helix-turn-helix domain protein [Clavibacter michiganensis subsp. michiganensis]OUE06523.1 Helix-turn-helix domain protein [Clavibacter michiganensis subsp. michiganensis]
MTGGRAAASVDLLRTDRAALTVDETAAVLGVGRATVYQSIREGSIPSLRLGRVIRVPVPALLALLGESASHEV